MTEIPDSMRLKLVEKQFEKISPGWMSTIVLWIIDSKFRTTKRLDAFISDQLINPHPDLVALASQFNNPNHDERIIDILRFVFEHVNYLPDSISYNKNEYWASAIETWNKHTDDCDGFGGLIGILAILSGMTEEEIYFSIGDVKEGGHFWVNYYSFKRDKLYVIDGTYYVDFTPIHNRNVFGLSEDRYKAIWYVFNQSGIYKTR